MATEIREYQIVTVANLLTRRGDDGGAPITRNGVGLNKVDYPRAGDILDEIKRRGALDRGNAFALIRLLRKYHRQIVELGFDLEAIEDEVHGLSEVDPNEPDDEDEGEEVEIEEYEPSGAPTIDDPALLPWGHVVDIPPMASILGRGGVIARSLTGYEPREAQIKLADAIAIAIAEKESILAEAGTGTGKSLAYLIPAIYSGKKILVSTEGKALQDQLANKDLPFLQDVLPVPVSFQVIKGVSNYLCLQKLEDVLEKQAQDTLPTLFDPGPRIPVASGSGPWTDPIVLWSRETVSGDLAEYREPLPDEYRAQVTATNDECMGSDCPLAGKCFALGAKARAKQANVVVVNHTLLALDIALRSRTDDGISILPDRDIVIVDEAHSLEDVATKAFTVEITDRSVDRLFKGKSANLLKVTDALVTAARYASQDLFAYIPTRKESSFLLPLTDAFVGLVNKLRDRLNDVVLHCKGVLFDIVEGEGEDAAAKLQKRGRAYITRVQNLMDNLLILTQNNAESVRYVERTQGKYTITALKVAPISVAQDLQDALWSRWPVVATSATLSTSNGLQYFRDRNGVDDAGEVVVGSPFNYAQNGLLYLPADGKALDPSLHRFEQQPAYFARLANQILQLVEASGGRAFLLFTSRTALDEVYLRAAPLMKHHTLLKQGDYSAAEMVRRFKDDGSAVLFGLRTFWAGVDVQGPALSLVVIDKLPFPQPDEPVYQARVEQLTAATGDKWAWFNQLALPLCGIQFKQGAGRLIRSKVDRGVLALLDGRLTHKQYGANILNSLPPFKRTQNLDDVRRFLGA